MTNYRAYVYRIFIRKIGRIWLNKFWRPRAQ